jgi:hypothetical protein
MPNIDLSKTNQLEDLSSAKTASVLPEDWGDREFREAFESLEIPKELFHHREHIRLAWFYSRHFPYEQAVSWMVQGIQAFAKHHGAAAKYHHTITVAWMRLVRHAECAAPRARDFSTFSAAHPQLSNPRLLEDYYSAARLQSVAARHAWIEPDLRPLP